MSARVARYWLRCNARPSCRSAPAAERPKLLSVEQLRAIGEAMRLFVEDDLANGVPAAAAEVCVACRRLRPLAGFIRYDGRMVCNGCATDYEIRRARGQVRSIGGYVDQFRLRGEQRGRS